MKKLVILMLAFVATANVFAIDYTAKAKIKVTSSTGVFDDATIAQSDIFPATPSSPYSSVKNMEGIQVGFYVVKGSNYQIYSVKDLMGTAFAFKSDAGTSYTMTISNVKGTQTLTMFDAVENKYFDLTEGATYTFTATANATVADRFSIKAKPAEPAICHQYGNLIITGHQGAKVKVLDMADQVAIAEQTLATDDEVISLSSLTKGEMYQVIVDDADPMLIRIQ